jgi:hypothetical protein
VKRSERNQTEHRVTVAVIGAQKAGTTSLLTLLGTHPQVLAHSADMEFTYFLNDRVYSRGYKAALERWYHIRAPEDVAGKILLAKNVGLSTWEPAIARLADHNPDVHLVMSLRHPVDRAYSAYWWARRVGREPLSSFEEAIAAEPGRLRENAYRWRQCAYLRNGQYASQLRTVFKYFRADQLRLFVFRDLVADMVSIANDILQPFGLHPIAGPATRANAASRVRSQPLAAVTRSDSLLPRTAGRFVPRTLKKRVGQVLRRINTQEFDPPSLDPDLRGRLLDHFRPHNAELSQMIDIVPEEWNV